MRAMICLLSLLGMLQTSWAAPPTRWQPLAPGIQYTQIPVTGPFKSSAVHAFRIDLQQRALHIAMAKDFQASVLSAKSFATLTHALVAINGGFFSPSAEALGLRHDSQGTRSQLKQTRWWSVFFIQNGRARIAKLREFRPNAQTQFAIQAGPRLLVNGLVPRHLKPHRDNRTAIGIHRSGDVILLATANAPLQTAQLGELMRSSEANGGLNCIDALNLDGGTSSQLFARIGKFSLNLPNFKRVTDAIIVR